MTLRPSSMQKSPRMVPGSEALSDEWMGVTGRGRQRRWRVIMGGGLWSIRVIGGSCGCRDADGVAGEGKEGSPRARDRALEAAEKAAARRGVRKHDLFRDDDRRVLTEGWWRR